MYVELEEGETMMYIISHLVSEMKDFILTILK